MAIQTPLYQKTGNWIFEGDFAEQIWYAVTMEVSFIRDCKNADCFCMLSQNNFEEEKDRLGFEPYLS